MSGPPMASGTKAASRSAGAASAGTLIICIFAALFDGFDGQLIGFVAPSISRDWSMPASEFGAVFSIGLFGLAIGAVAIAPLGDRFGRKRIALGGAIAVTLFTLMTALVQNAWQLAAVRMLTCIGLGALMPILVTIAHEAAPPKLGGIFVTLLVTAFPLGSFLGGMLVAWGLEHGSWRDIFITAGVFSAIFPFLFWRFMKLPQGSPSTSQTAVTPVRVGVRTLFGDRMAIGTTLIWILFFASLLNTYMFGAWLPLLLERGGLDATDAVRITALFGLGGTFGGLVLGFAAARWGGFVLGIAYVVAAACLIGLTMTGNALGATSLLVGLIGALIAGGHVGNSVLAVRNYPAAMNATGVGWAQGVGRVGCVTGPALVGIAVAQGAANPVIFAGAAAFAVLGAAAAFGLAIRDARRARTLTGSASI